MRPTPAEPSKSLLGRGTCGGDLSGYLSLSLTALLFTIPYLPRTLAPIKIAMGLSVLALVVGLAVRGTSRGHGGGKVAAWLSLAVVGFTMLASVVIEGSRVLAEMMAETNGR